VVEKAPQAEKEALGLLAEGAQEVSLLRPGSVVAAEKT
jgi:hypothetical protein